MKKLFLKTIILRSYSFKMVGGITFQDGAPRESQLKIFK